MYSLCCYVARSNDTVQQFNIAKWTYCCCFSIVAVITWLLRDYADDFFVNHVSSFSYCKDPQYQQLCTGKQVAQRFSFANFVFFATHAVLLFGLKREDDPRAGLHISMWFWKLAAWAGTIVGFFFVPVDAVLIYTQIARVGSGLFLIFQVIELINFVYVINEYLTEREQCWSWTVLVLGSGLCFCGGLALLGVCYHFYAPSPSCSLNIFFITWTIIMMLAMVMVLFVPDRARSAGLLTSGAVFAYCAYLTLSSLSSEPKSDSCVRLGGTSSGWIQVRRATCTIRLSSLLTWLLPQGLRMTPAWPLLQLRHTVAIDSVQGCGPRHRACSAAACSITTCRCHAAPCRCNAQQALHLAHEACA